LLVLGLFAETMIIFVISPMVTDLPFVNLAGQFLLKGPVYFAVTLMVIAVGSSKYSKAPGHDQQGETLSLLQARRQQQ
jgi:hypothetical protein